MIRIIAEAGVNHNGDEALAVALIDAAHQAGVDVVKFQTFKAANLVTRQAKQAAYQTANTGKPPAGLPDIRLALYAEMPAPPGKIQRLSDDRRAA